MASWSALARRIRVPLGFAFAALYLWLAHPTRLSLLAAAPLIIAGVIVRALASGHVQKNQQLTTSGPYAYTRNPLYLGSLILACGFALTARSIWIVAGVVVFFTVIYVPVIRSEEAYLRQHFSQFDEYAHRVPSLLPRLTPFESSRGTFSWELYRKHGEYNALLGSASLVAVLIAKLIWLQK